ncbi:MAG: hypothetical protein V4573_13475 [Pseudomonadota bacterium]
MNEHTGQSVSKTYALTSWPLSGKAKNGAVTTKAPSGKKRQRPSTSKTLLPASQSTLKMGIQKRTLVRF